MSISMAIVDYIPVGLFLAAAILLQRDLYNKMSKGAFALFSAGTITIFLAGFLKATWKLLYCAGVCDFVALNKTFFPMQTIGFVLTGIGLMAMLCYNQGTSAVYSVAVAPAVFEGTMLFVVLMILGVLITDVSMCIISKKAKKASAIIWFVVSFVFVMGMGYLSTKDFANPSMNWLAEGVNIIGQGAFLMGSISLHRAGLAEKKF